LTTDQESVPYPYRVGTTMSGITFGGEAGLAFRDGSGVARFRLGVGYLRHLIYPEHSGGITRLVLSVDL
ncbi:MAG TPA: hypothetical protein PLL69_06375, partial [Gemmatimonadales bacterium]|nr:hypothetical protein [Gemmatimonadales bacterium]